MPKVLSTFLFFLGIGSFLLLAQPSYAQTITANDSKEVNINLGDPVTIKVEGISNSEAVQVRIVFNLNNIDAPGNVARATADTRNGGCDIDTSSWPSPAGASPSCTGPAPYTFTLPLDTSKFENDKNSQTTMVYKAYLSNGGPSMGAAQINIQPTALAPRTFFVQSIAPSSAKPGERVNITLLINNAFGQYKFFMAPGPTETENCNGPSTTCTHTFTIPNGVADTNTRILITDPSGNQKSVDQFTVILPTPVTNSIPTPTPTTTTLLCTQADIDAGNCTSASGDPCQVSINGKSSSGVKTAIGCIPTEPTALVESILRVGIGAGGGIALLLMVAGAFGFITSGGNPDALKSSTERFISAIIGLLIIVFSVLLLQIIGVDILNIPGFK